MKKVTPEPTRFDPKAYWLGCGDRLHEAEQAMACNKPGLALTLAGVAAECAMRACLPPDNAFDGRHDMRLLLKAIRRQIPEDLHYAGTRLRLLWRNSYRYMGIAQQRQVVKMLPELANAAPAVAIERAAIEALTHARTAVKYARHIHQPW